MVSSSDSVGRSSVHTDTSDNASVSVISDDLRQVEDLEAQEEEEEDEEEEVVLLPGAFFCPGMGDEPQQEGQNQGVSGYDSGFEDDDSDVEDPEIVTILSSGQELDDNSEIPGGGSIATTAAAAAAAVVTSTPLQAELYEVEAAVAAEILIEEDDDDLNGKDSVRKMSVKISFVMFALLLVAGIVMGVVIPRVGNKNDDNSGNPNDQDDTPIVEGWTQVGEILTVEDASKDNIRFGTSVALSSDGNRIAGT